MHSGRALGSQAEKSKNKQKPPLASKTIKDMLVKSGILGGVLGWTETAKSKLRHLLTSKSHKNEGMLIKSSVLGGFWAAGLKLRKASVGFEIV